MDDQNGVLPASIDDFLQSDIAQKAVEMGYHHDLIRRVVTQHFRETGRQFSTAFELLESIWDLEAKSQDIVPTLSDVEAMDVDDPTSVMSSMNVDILPGKLAGLSIHDEASKKRSPPSTREPLVTPNASLQPQISFIEDFSQSDIAQKAVDMGFSRDLINDVLNQHFIRTGQQFFTLNELLELIWKEQGQSIDPTPSGEAGKCAGVRIEDERRKKRSPPSTREPLVTPNASLQPQILASSGSSDPDKQLCKICLDNERSTLFWPCKHLVACSDCAAKVTECPMCRQPIIKSLEVYMP